MKNVQKKLNIDNLKSISLSILSYIKVWVGPAKASAKVELRKEDSNNALQTQELNVVG
ncbi:hypothetical protein [Peptostreptococcus stomatis]|uniref:hypothetical protein n=1 Tax=Peptostreptococcus stomatis TaxID=341694 RepID=UPI003FA0E094